MIVTVYALARSGVHKCDGWAYGPVPPIYDPTFSWPAEISWGVFHDEGTVMLVQFAVPEEWFAEWAPKLNPDAFMTPTLYDLCSSIVAAAVSDMDSLGAINARKLLTSIGFTTREQWESLVDNPLSLMESCSSGIRVHKYQSLMDAVRAGFKP